MHTAPVSPREPPTISTCPELNLVDSCPRRGASANTSAAIRPAGASIGAPLGIPISATRTFPACHLPGAIQCPSFAAWKLTLTSARTAAPSTSPLDASTPEAMSAETTGASPAFIASIAASAGARGAPLNPVPKIASTTTPAPARASPSWSGAARREDPVKRRKFASASPESSSGGHSSSASTSYPVSRSLRAATSPSPALLPFPHTTTARPERASSPAARAVAPPAASISSSDGTP